MKKRWLQVFAGCIMFVLCISVCTTTANAAEVWSEYFEGPIEDWTTFGYIYDGYPVPTEGNFSVASGELEVLDDDVNVARHDSDMTVGTWSFDMFVPEDDDGHGHVYVEFMSNGSSFLEFGNASFVSVGAWFDGDAFVVWTIVGSSWKALSNIHVNPLQGWHHIEVSRTNDANFYVYFNGNETPAAHFTYTAVTSSTYLQFICNSAKGAAIDNIIVEDTSIDWLPIAAMGVSAVVIIVVVVIILRRR